MFATPALPVADLTHLQRVAPAADIRPYQATPPVACTHHVYDRIYERFPRMRGMSRGDLRLYLARALETAPTIGESVMKDQRFAEITLGDRTPMVLVVADRPHQPPLVITALTRDMAEKCGTMRRLPTPATRSALGLDR